MPSITFTHYGKSYTGSLEPVKGAAEPCWYLMIDNYHCGRLRIQQGKWVFDPTPKTKSFVELADYFGSCVEGE